MYDFHLNEIFATIQNEYSDWSNDNSDRVRKVSWHFISTSVSKVQNEQEYKK